MSDIIRNETAHTINGVHGRLFTLRRPPATWKAGTFDNQTWKSESRKVDSKYCGIGAAMSVSIQFDDQCRNGHNSFTITAEIKIPGRRDVGAYGCLHDEIKTYFPELAYLIQWNLFSTDGPTGYVANTVYFAGNRDCLGKAAGEPIAYAYGFRFADSPVTWHCKTDLFKFINERLGSGEFTVMAIEHKNDSGAYKFEPKYTFVGYGDKWHECPFNSLAEAEEVAKALNTTKVEPVKIATEFSEGKARELDKARTAAVWPEATDEELSVSKEELTAALNARLPELLVRMRSDVEQAGFMWSCPLNSTNS